MRNVVHILTNRLSLQEICFGCVMYTIKNLNFFGCNLRSLIVELFFQPSSTLNVVYLSCIVFFFILYDDAILENV